MKTDAVAIANAVETILDAATGVDVPTLSEAEIVHRVVEDFGNKGLLNGPLLAVASATGETGASVLMLRKEFRMQLALIAAGQVSDLFRTQANYEADRMVLVPRTNETGVAFRIFPENMDAVIGYVLKLLVRGPYGRDLKQCQLCGQFFFVSVRRQKSGQETGRSPDRYCSKEHMTIAHRQEATKATMQRRRKLKEQREAKRQGLHKRKQEQKR